MSETRPHERLAAALCSLEVRTVADHLREAPERTLARVLELGAVLARACGDDDTAARLSAEVGGYEGVDEDALPDVRRVGAFASPFPVRALDLGLLDAEEVFLVNREKFSHVTLAIAQPVDELETALEELGDAGVLSLRVPASQVNGRSADTPHDDHVHIYVLPREIRRILDAAREAALDALVGRLLDAAPPSD